MQKKNNICKMIYFIENKNKNDNFKFKLCLKTNLISQ